MLFTAVKGRKANASIQPQKTAPAPPVGHPCHAPPRAIIFLLFVLPLAGLRAGQDQGWAKPWPCQTWRRYHRHSVVVGPTVAAQRPRPDPAARLRGPGDQPAFLRRVLPLSRRRLSCGGGLKQMFAECSCDSEPDSEKMQKLEIIRQKLEQISQIRHLLDS